MNALQFLQTSLYETVDHENADQVKEFQALASTLFRPPGSPNSPFGSSGDSESSSLEEDSGAGSVPAHSSGYGPSSCPAPPVGICSDSGSNSNLLLPLASPTSSSNIEDFDDSFSGQEERITALPIEEVHKIIQKERLKVFQQISLYMPEDMAQPKANLIDFIPY